MTLIIVLACKDGLVMAADSQVTLLSSGGPVRQEAIKIKQVGQTILWAGSGEVGFLQKIEKGLDALPNEMKKASLEKLKAHFVATIHTLRKEALDRRRELYGSTKGASGADVLFCGYSDNAQILHISKDAQDEELQEFGYAASGIGDTFAYTLLRGKDIKNMSCEEGKVLAYRVIHEAVEVGAFGLGEPIDIWVIRKTKKEDKESIELHRLLEEEMDAIRDTYFALKEAEAEIFSGLFKAKPSD